MSSKPILLLGIPRSCSTLIEGCLSESDSFIKAIHEPLWEYAYYSQNKSKCLSNLNTYLESENILLKEMTQWIVKDELYNVILPKIQQPIIIIIRNPIFCIESKIEKILRGVHLRERVGFQKYLFNTEKEYEQKDLLSMFAIQNGYISWHEFIINVISSRNYESCSPILRYFTDKHHDLWGWSSLLEVVDYSHQNGVNYLVIESDKFRNEPEQQLKIVCQLTGIHYNDNMLEPTYLKIYNPQLSGNGKFWYTDFSESEKILNNTRTLCDVTKFPDFIRNYIKNIANPIYEKLVTMSI